MASEAATLVEVPTKRAVWRIALTAAALTLLVIGLAVAAFLVYHDKTSEISDLTKQRETLEATNTTLRHQLTDTQTKLRKVNKRLRTTDRRLTLAKKNLTKLRKDLVAADNRARANYSAGYNVGSSAGYTSGYSSGRDAGLTQASDELTCSDDPDVTWLPYCN